jgi:hypothetical protein
MCAHEISLCKDCLQETHKWCGGYSDHQVHTVDIALGLVGNSDEHVIARGKDECTECGLKKSVGRTIIVDIISNNNKE